MPGIEAILIERLVESIDLGTCDLDFGLADLAEILGADIPGQQTDDHHHHQQFEQRKTG